ncbi:pEP153R [African swine fever virus]|uniref:Lectin-like protein EP153R n=2 Tax=African swine fever virus TaxID=10497 RepID=EP153_ASFP4|nr:RecName: Full=Lectin-like protein EP153R; Short=pEP153R [African swine fever virus tick/South Africa/Pretoriuskop Pr4/1996]AAC28421.1 lectin homolog [African swine fever virus]AAF24969.1 c-type lectin protein [African swine fever virus]QII88579.1 pEP153R [African swine fever virus]
MYFKKKYIGLIDKNCEKKILDDCTTIKICYILIGILIGTNMITLIYNFIFWDHYMTCNKKDKMFYCPKDWVGYNNVCYYFNNDSKNYTTATNSCKQLNSTLANNDTNLLNLTKVYHHDKLYWVNYSLNDNFSLSLRNSTYEKRSKYLPLLFICSK